MKKTFHGYTITDEGRVFSKTGRELTQRTTRKGYRLVTLNTKENGRGRGYFVHRLVALLFVFNPMPAQFLQVNHIDGNPANNRAGNLEWCNGRMNVRHGHALRRHKILDQIASKGGAGTVNRLAPAPTGRNPGNYSPHVFIVISAPFRGQYGTF